MQRCFKISLTYLETILELIEDSQQVQMPLFFYCGLIAMFYFQALGYIYSNYEFKPIGEQKAAYLARIGEISPGTFLLYYKGNDVLTLMGLAILDGALIFYYCYAGFIIIMKQRYSILLEEWKSYLQQINKFLNVFLTFFWWVFSVPFIEINIGILMCGGNAFLKVDRDKDYDVCIAEKPVAIYLICSLGLVLTFVTGCVVILFFRNYRFNEENKLKRRSVPWISIVQFSARTGVMACYYAGTLSLVPYKHVLGYILALSLLLDLFYYFPYADIRVTQFFIFASGTFLILQLMTTVWLYTNSWGGYQFFYSIFLAAPLLYFINITFYMLIYDQIMMEFGTTLRSIEYTDYYTEQLSYIAENSNVDQEHKIRLLYYLIQHKQTCRSVVCQCKNMEKPIFRHQICGRNNDETNHTADMSQLNNMIENLQHSKSLASQTLTNSSKMPSKDRRQSSKIRENILKKQKKDGEDDTESISQTIQTLKTQQEEKQDEVERMKKSDDFLDLTQFYKFITGIMKTSLNHTHIQKNQNLFEQLSLKYISFLAKYRNNAARSYYELRLQTKRAQLSFYFSQLSKILSGQIQNMIIQQQLVGMNQEDESHQNQGQGRILQKLEGFEHKRLVSDSGSLSIQIISDMENQTIKWTQLIIQYLKKKESFWGGLEMGYRTMQEIQNRGEKLSDDLQIFMEEFSLLQKKTRDSNKNILHHKICQITSFLVFNDYEQAIYHEKQSAEYYNRDQSKSQKELSILKYIVNDNIMLNVSIMRNKGVLLNKKTTKLAEFFGYSFESFQKIHTINQLMPASIAQIHNGLIDRYLKRGYSNIMNGAYRELFILNGRNYIEQVKVQLSTVFDSKDDFTQLGAILKINQNKDFLVCDMFGRITSVSEQLFKNIREKYLLLNNTNDESRFLLSQFLKNVTIFTLFPDLVEVFKKFVLVLLGGKKEVDQDQAISELLAQRINELTVVKNQRVQMLITQNFLDQANNFKENVDHLAHDEEEEKSDTDVKNRLLARMLTAKPASKIPYKFAHQAKIKSMVSKQGAIVGLSLLNLLELNEAENLAMEYRQFLQDVPVFKYFTKVEIKCCVLAQRVQTSPNEIYFTIQLNDRKISKEALYSIFQMKTMSTKHYGQHDQVNGDGPNTPQSNKKKDDLKMLQRGLKSTKHPNSSFQNSNKSRNQSDDDSFPNFNQKAAQVTYQSQTMNADGSDTSQENDSENQIEEDITLNSSFTENKLTIKHKHHNGQGNDMKSIATTTSSKSSLMQSQVIIKRIIDDTRRDSLTKQFIYINFYMFLIFLFFFLMIQIMISMEFDYLVAQTRTLQNYKDLHQIYQGALIGSIIIFDRRMLPSKSYDQDVSHVLTNVSVSLVNNSFSRYQDIVNENYPFILDYKDYQIREQMSVLQRQTLNEEVSLLSFISLIGEQIQSLQFHNPDLDYDSFQYLYQNYENHLGFYVLSLVELEIHTRDYSLNQQLIIDIISFSAAFVLFFPIVFSFRINNKINRYYTMILNIISRISFAQAANQRQIVQKSIQLLGQDSMKWAYYDFKDLCLQLEAKHNNKEEFNDNKKKKLAFNYSVLSESINQNRISAVYCVISVFFVLFFVVSAVYYNSINSKLHDYIRLHHDQINQYYQTTSFVVSNEILALQTLIKSQKNLTQLQISDEYRDRIKQIIINSLNSLRGFIDLSTASLPNSNSAFESIKQILIGDMCSQTDGVIAMEVCKLESTNYYQNGLGGLISELLKYYDTYEGESIFQRTNEHVYLFWLSYPIIDWAFNKISSITVQLIDVDQSQKYQNLQIYWFVVGFAGLFGQSFIGYWTYKRIRKQLRNHKLMLTLLPFSSLEENSTRHLLKQLSEFI